jgi:hypothetical protein
MRTFTTLIQLAMICFMLVLAGCSKKQERIQNDANAGQALLKDTTTGETLVQTPFGLAPKSKVHIIDSGYHVSFEGGHLLKIHTKTGKVAEDYGIQKPVGKFAKENGNQVVPTLGSGWITYGQVGYPILIKGFNTQWTVPSSPATYRGQGLFIFNGLQDGFGATDHILQPVLQYGLSAIGGGNKWMIANWYASCQGCDYAASVPVDVTPGTVLVGNITGTTSSPYNYTSSFYSLIGPSPSRVHYYPQNNSLTVNNVPQLQYAFETMEAYGMQQNSDYPADNVCKMTYITAYPPNGSTRPGGTPPLTLTWTPYNIITDVGQHTIVVGSSEVDLYFH